MNDYQRAAEETFGASLNDYFGDYINGTEPFEKALKPLMNDFGLNFELVASERIEERYFGFRVAGNKVVQIASGSPCDRTFRSGHTPTTRIRHRVALAGPTTLLAAPESPPVVRAQCGETIIMYYVCFQLLYVIIYVLLKCDYDTTGRTYGICGTIIIEICAIIIR